MKIWSKNTISQWKHLIPDTWRSCVGLVYFVLQSELNAQNRFTKTTLFFFFLPTNKFFASKYQAAAWGKCSRFQQILEDPEVRVNTIPTLLTKMWGFLNYLICLLTHPTGKVGLRQLSGKDSVIYSPWIIKTLKQCILLPTLGQGLENVLSLL